MFTYVGVLFLGLPLQSYHDGPKIDLSSTEDVFIARSVVQKKKNPVLRYKRKMIYLFWVFFFTLVYLGRRKLYDTCNMLHLTFIKRVNFRFLSSCRTKMRLYLWL